MHCDQQIRPMSGGESIIRAIGVFGNLALRFFRGCKPDQFWVHPFEDNQSLVPRK